MARGLSKKGFEGRIWDKISPEPNSGCWLWIGTGTTAGYGQVFLNGKLSLAHRSIYEFHIGKIPDGMDLDHACRVPCCVNPAHLEPVTHKENMERGIHANKTHCLRGHLYSSENTIFRSGGRVCRICERERRQSDEYRAGRRAYAKSR